MATCGFYGKLPGEGDFVTRRLPWEFTAAWDDWLQQGMQASRAALGDGWLGLYLSAPIWRFQLAPGVCGPLAWRGLFFASVDRVGRYFPLTLAFAGPGLPVPDGVASTLAADAGGWLAAEDAGLAGLAPRLLLDDFDLAIQALAEPAAEPADAVAPARVHFLSAATDDAPSLRLAFPALPPAARFVEFIAPSAPPPASSLLDTLAS
ncbi:MAG: type VI secretion system-associated protein TagF [Burkholderiales bacterium]|nr:type VI secretion system-associated protein TagF [Burkholderiales bacterium]